MNGCNKMNINEPRLRTVNKAQPPYLLNKFPKSFIKRLGRELVYLMATKTTDSLVGDEWENIFAICVGAKWRPSNVGLDDVVLDNCCWGAKTVKASTKNILTQKGVRLISGRNSPVYSYDAKQYLAMNPYEIGEMVLNIWNERVSGVRQLFKFVRTVVLIKGKSFNEFCVFELDTFRYDPDIYSWQWNKKNNLDGFDRNQNHCFTWQPHGSQFTILKSIPENATIFKLRKPEPLNKNEVLSELHYSDDWLEIIKSG